MVSAAADELVVAHPGRTVDARASWLILGGVGLAQRPAHGAAVAHDGVCDDPFGVGEDRTHRGEPVVFDRESGVDLVDAGAASTSAMAPYPIGERRYLNGGYRRRPLP